MDRIVDILSRMSNVVIHRNLVGTYETVRAGWIQAGLGVGTADLVGWVTVDTPYGVMARFLAIQVKQPGRDKRHKEHEEEQARWLSLVRNMGGIAGVAHSPDEAIALIEGQTMPCGAFIGEIVKSKRGQRFRWTGEAWVWLPTTLA